MSRRPTIGQIRQFTRENKGRPLHLVEVPRAEWTERMTLHAFAPTGSIAVQVFQSREFLLVVWDQAGTTRLSVMRTDFDIRTRHQRADITWDDLQRLKSEAGFGDATAVEIYPPDKRVVNVANMRHLFIVDAPDFMW